MYLVQSTVKLAMLAKAKHEKLMQTNSDYRKGWCDANKGEDFIQDDMPFWYYEAVANYINQKSFNEV